ncbi:ATP-binding protein [Thermomonospora amylolytica]|uniref:ATP-binding protein n=1 Tax=Thermomonospora amylolytica TaxID=1411117 RepID=UPI000E6CFDFB|nr:AAA family ATPase [Thermomonospora amylolytica]
MTAPLIGRDHAAGMLRAEIGRAIDSHGGLVLVTGEAGIGKTTLVGDAAAEARRRGALVLGGSCWESGGAPGHWPWVQVLRGLRRASGAAEWAELEEASGGATAVLLGESAAADETGFALYDGVTSALVAASQRRPVMVVLDDLHWADAASVRLLEFAAQHTWFERLLLVGTYRDVEVEPTDHPLRPLLSALVSRATMITLTGLDRAAVGELMARTAGRRPDDDVVAEVHRRTGGNPFFVEQSARLWSAGGPVEAIAPGVRDAVQRRLSLLPEPVVRLLTTAAVLGREFHRQVLAAVAAEPADRVDRLLGRAVAARLAVARGGGRFAFAHDLVRETLYDSLDEPGRRHAAVVEAVTRSPGLAGRLLPAEQARHAYLARDVLDPATVVGRLEHAARDAGARMAFEESTGHRRRALEVAAALGPRRQALIAGELGADLIHLGRRDEGWALLEFAAERARAAADPMVLARVAITLHHCGDGDERARPAEDLLADAHRALAGGTGDPTPRDRPAKELAKEVAVHASARARREEDDEALAYFLWSLHHLIWGPGTAAERERLTREIERITRRMPSGGDHDSPWFAAALRWVALLELGDPRYLDAFETSLALAEQGGRPHEKAAATADRGIIAAFQGRFAEAADLLAEATCFPEGEHFDAHGMMFHLHWALLLLQGRADEDPPGRPPPRGSVPARLIEGLTALYRDDPDTALHHLEALTRSGRPIPGMYAPLFLRLQAQVAAATRDPELCERARAALSPYAGQWAVSVYGCDIGGPYRLWQAAVDAAQERWDEAVQGFTAAAESAELMHSRPWALEARTGLAEVLAERGDAGAAALLDEVEREAAELGMRHIAARVRRIRRSRDGGAGETGGEFRFDGRVWSLTFAGRTVHMPDAKGLRDLHLLLSGPGTDVPAVRLANPEGGAEVAAARALGGDEVLDEEARIRYKRRLAELDEEIDRAVAAGDDERAAACDRERAALLAELRAAAGLAGRTRRLGDEAERARKTVTARIRDTLRKLDGTHPDLAAHLRDAVSTGTTCAYRPSRPVTWRL